LFGFGIMSDQLEYLRFGILTSASGDITTVDALAVRKAIQDALMQTFGLSYAGVYVDVLWVGAVKENDSVSRHTVIRASSE
jgi:hypothetical protein